MKEAISKNRGFTLVEMLVVIFIIGLISSTLVFSWRKNERQYKLQMAAQKIVQDIRKAQEIALAGKQVWDGPQGQYTVPNSFGVYFNRTSPRSYIIFGDILGNPGYQSGSADVVLETASIESGIEIYSLSGGNFMNITFSIPDGFTSILQGPSNQATITIRRINASCPSKNCKSIIVKNTGEISIQ